MFDNVVFDLVEVAVGYIVKLNKVELGLFDKVEYNI